MNKDSVVFGFLMGITFSFIVYNLLHFLNGILFSTLFDGRNGLSDKFVAIITVVSNVIIIKLLNNQYRFEAAKGTMMSTMVLVFVVLYFFRNELLGN